MSLLVIRLLALLSAVGGPLYLYDLLAIGPRDIRIFAFCFAPIALMILGSLSFGDPPSDRLARFFVRLGLFGAIALALMNGFTIYSLINGESHPNQVLIIVGIGVGAFTVILYGMLARAFLDRATPI